MTQTESSISHQQSTHVSGHTELNHTSVAFRLWEPAQPGRHGVVAQCKVLKSMNSPAFQMSTIQTSVANEVRKELKFQMALRHKSGVFTVQ